MARSDGGRARWEPEEVWVEDPEPEEARPTAAPARSAEVLGHRFNVPRPVVDELAHTAGSQRGGKLAERLASASHAYDRERYQEAKRMLRPLAEEVPNAAAVRELLGLTMYRMGQWAPAAKELEEYRKLSGSVDQHPVLADCYRALHRYRPAAELWEELRTASPSAEAIAEGRIVAAGCLADQGDLKGAIALLEKASRQLRNPEDHHLRQWYVLADLYERAGDLPRARELFGRLVSVDADAYDARRRLAGLR
jgi:tetratricopeptide (TPR) repeat protein